MSDPRFARLKTDPRFRRPKTKSTKVVIDDRFKSVFETTKNKSNKAARKVDKYGRPVSKTQDQDNLRRYYRLEHDDENENEQNEDEAPRKPDLARGDVLLESSSEEEDEEQDDDEDSADDGGFVTLGADSSRPISVPDEIDLDEEEDSGAYAYAEAQAAQYAREHPDVDADADEEGEGGEGKERTRRLAIVNLDWEHVRAHHLFKICVSLVSPTAPLVPASSSRIDDTRNKKRSSQGAGGGGGVSVARGRVLSVRVYPSDFGKARMAKEEVEGPPAYLFSKKSSSSTSPDDVNERTVYEVGGEEDQVDTDALRRYQLERLRYFYAVVECDSVSAAGHIFNELEGTELERSANLFDLSFVPDGMTFENEPRDEATEEEAVGAVYRPVDYVTDALRHSKVKLTWDDDDPERNQVTRRALTRKEIEENDFRAYIASTSSESEGEGDDGAGADQAQRKKAPSKKDKKEKKAAREKLRALLLGGNDDAMPEGWGEDGGADDDDVDMEITFTPGLTGKKDDGDETTLERYQRKMREKRKKRKEDVKSGKDKEEGDVGGGTEERDEFFEAGSDDAGEAEAPKKAAGKKDKKGKKPPRHSATEDNNDPVPPRKEATTEELALLVASDNPTAEPKHFSLKAVIKAEKTKKKMGKGKKAKRKGGEDKDGDEAQEDFVMDVKDDRFKVLFEDHQYAIDPTNPHFKKTKSMTALLDERQKRQRAARGEDARPDVPASSSAKRKSNAQEPGADAGAKSLQSLVESVKRKSANAEAPGQGKRRKL